MVYICMTSGYYRYTLRSPSLTHYILYYTVTGLTYRTYWWPQQGRSINRRMMDPWVNEWMPCGAHPQSPNTIGTTSTVQHQSPPQAQSYHHLPHTLLSIRASCFQSHRRFLPHTHSRMLSYSASAFSGLLGWVWVLISVHAYSLYLSTFVGTVYVKWVCVDVFYSFECVRQRVTGWFPVCMCSCACLLYLM